LSKYVPFWKGSPMLLMCRSRNWAIPSVWLKKLLSWYPMFLSPLSWRLSEQSLSFFSI
jgi:hypothetical protein